MVMGRNGYGPLWLCAEMTSDPFEIYIILTRIYSIRHYKAELNEAELLLRGLNPLAGMSVILGVPMHGRWPKQPIYQGRNDSLKKWPKQPGRNDQAETTRTKRPRAEATRIQSR